MDFIESVAFGIGLRFLVTALRDLDKRLGWALVGLWDGYTVHQMPDRTYNSQFTYLSFSVLDLIISQNLSKTLVIFTWALLGVLLSDALTPKHWYDYNHERRTRRSRHGHAHPRSVPTATRARSSSLQQPTSTSPAWTTDLPASASPESATSSAIRSPSSISSGSLTETPRNGPHHLESHLPSPPETYAPYTPIANEAESRPDKSSTPLDTETPTPPARPIDTPLEMISIEHSTATDETPYMLKMVPPMMLRVQEDTIVQASPSSHDQAAEGSGQHLAAPQEQTLLSPLDMTEDTTVDRPPILIIPPPTAQNDETATITAPQPSNNTTEASSDEDDTTSSFSHNSLDEKADSYRKAANAEDKETNQLRNLLKNAERDGRQREAVSLRSAIKESEQKALRLHRKADRRYFRADNSSSHPQTVDVHRLSSSGALIQLGESLQSFVSSDHAYLQLVVGQKMHGRAVKAAIIRELEKNKIVYNDNQDSVIISQLPS